jgi:hypothetical protein
LSSTIKTWSGLSGVAGCGGALGLVDEDVRVESVGRILPASLKLAGTGIAVEPVTVVFQTCCKAIGDSGTEVASSGHRRART